MSHIYKDNVKWLTAVKQNAQAEFIEHNLFYPEGQAD